MLDEFVLAVFEEYYGRPLCLADAKLQRLDPTPPSLHFFEGLAGKQAFVREQGLAKSVKHPGSSGLLSGQTPWAFLLGAALLAALLAANEQWNGALDLSALRRRA